MGSEDNFQKLGNIVVNFDSKRIPISGRERNKRPGKYPYYGATGIMDYIDDYIFDGLYLLIAEDGSVENKKGQPFLQLANGKFWVSNHAHVIRGSTDEDTKYLYYALSAIKIRPYITGSVQAKLSQKNLNRITVYYPERRERVKILHILGTLDDKIELNQRMNETLEAMARALFKAWFVDFEPVKAKMNGEPYPLPKEIMDLFPDELVESELGPIPKGWRVGIISDFGKIVCGKTPPKSNSAYYGGEIPFIKIPDMHKSVFITKTSDTLTKFGADFQKSKYLPPFSIMVSCIATVGLVSLTSRISQTNQQINAIIPNNVEYCYYVYYSMINISDHLKALGSTGSATLNVNTSEFSKIYVLLPKDDLAIAFYKIVDPLFRIIMRNEDVWQCNQTINVLLGNLFS